MVKVTIYELVDPRSNLCRYVGQTCKTNKRLWEHENAAKRGHKGRVYNWIRSLQAAGVHPEIRALETCDGADADACEARWIQRRHLEGVDLTNCTLGGPGLRGWSHSPETKTKIGAAHRGKIVSRETRARVSATKRASGWRPSEEHRAALLRAAKTRPRTLQERQAASERMRGNTRGAHPHTPESIVNSIRGARHGEEAPRAAVTNQQAKEIRQCVANGERQCDIAKRLGVGRPVVCNIIKGKTYKDR
jgi:hypothetical protein